MSDIIASARSMTTYADGQYVAVGFPKGGLTPATITAMVGFSKGEGLEANPIVGQAVSALANVPNTSPLYGTAQSLSTRLSSLSSKLTAGGPAAIMQKLNTARGHIADTIELKKVTAFTANQSLSSFGSGISKMSSLSTGGLDGALGNLGAAAAAMTAAGPLFDLGDMSNFGSPVGLINKLTSSKMANSSGVTAALAKAGIDSSNLTNPANADKVKKVLAGINDPKALKDIADQFGIKPPGGLPEVGKQSFSSLINANPFAGTPSYVGADSSLNTSAASTLLGGATAEPSADPINWAKLNNLSSTATAPINNTTQIAKINEDIEWNNNLIGMLQDALATTTDETKRLQLEGEIRAYELANERLQQQKNSL